MGKETAAFRDLNPMLVYVAIVGSMGAMSLGYDSAWWGE